MDIGILQVDSVLPRFRLRHGDYPDMFGSLFLRAGREVGEETGCENSVRVRNFDVLAGDLPQARACDGYVITGSRQSVYEELPWLPALVDFAAQAMAVARPVIGICFGHQLLAHYFGGEVAPAEAGWGVGVHTSAVVEHHSWMDPPLQNIAMLVSHKDQVRALPAGAEVFASSDFCPIAGFRIGSSALAFQSHPEFQKAYSSDLMDMRRKMLGGATYARGKASLAQDTHEREVARWILNFIREARGRP
ncbi:MAG: hypothetical protein QF921_01775 [Pseudomonadales bacterium]|nr:hypothetical protein [Pseudomonadales bacterium]MDP6471046.1 hypothetical protein [Pseudomonadales bacterium]MDP6825768.1 hypothetical protein [Pseudomonadales bacterium]MDP6970238.1 hypothetical protein [Pseudomonadales bacterium]